MVGFVDISTVDLVPGSEFLVNCADVLGALLSNFVGVSGALVSVLELTAVLATLVTVSDRAMEMERFLSRRLARLLAALRLRNCFVDSVIRTMNCVWGSERRCCCEKRVRFVCGGPECILNAPGPPHTKRTRCSEQHLLSDPHAFHRLNDTVNETSMQA